jgi:hypothetical protein
MEKKFRTKTGYCHILKDKIVLTKYGTVGEIARLSSGSHAYRLPIMYVLFVAASAYLVYAKSLQEKWSDVVFFALFCIYFAYGIFSGFRYSAIPVIDRSSIRKFRFIRGIRYVTRSRFEVSMEAANGKLRKRLIILPGTLGQGKHHTEEALAMLRSENLLTP